MQREFSLCPLVSSICETTILETYPLFSPVRSIPYDVVSSLMGWAQDLGGHVLILS